MANECKKCSVVHSSLTEVFYWEQRSEYKVSRTNFGLPLYWLPLFVSKCGDIKR